MLERVLAGAFLIAFIPLVLSEYNHWQLLGPYDGLAVAIIAVVFFFLVIRPNLIKTPSRKQEALYAARSIRKFLDGSGGVWDWDDFTSLSLADPTVDAIRRRAAAVILPVGDNEKPALAALADEAERVASANGSQPSKEAAEQH